MAFHIHYYMPIDVMKNMVEYLDIVDRIKLAKTSRSLQTFVEDQKLFHHTLKLIFDYDIPTISFDKSDNIMYLWKDVRRKKRLRYWERACLDLKNILKNPKLHLENLEIQITVNNRKMFNKMENALKLTHHLNVKNLIFRDFSSYKIPNIVSKLKPGYLTKIDISFGFPTEDSMEKLFDMEQWKRAKCFSMAVNRFIWPLHHLYHFEKFTVVLNKLSVDDIRQMKEILFKSPNFETCLIWVLSDTGANAIEEEFGDYVLQERNTSNDSKIYHYPIPNSTEYFNIEVLGRDIDITKIKR